MLYHYHYTMASPGFGFSVRDISTGIEVAVKICKACRGTGGGPDQFQRVTLELEAYISVLHRLQDVRYSSMSEVEKLAMCCERPINDFGENFAKYEDSFSKVSSSGHSLRGVIQSVKVSPRKAQWAVMASMEMEKLRAGLEAQLSALVLML